VDSKKDNRAVSLEIKLVTVTSGDTKWKA